MICTKVGRLLEPASEPYGADAEGFAVPAAYRRVRDFSADGVRRSLEASLDRLGLDRVDIALIHDPDDYGEQAFREAYPALEELRAQGCVRAIGAGMNQAEMLTRFVTDTDVDVVLVAGRYTLLDQSAAAELLPAARGAGSACWSAACSTPACWRRPDADATYDYQAAPGRADRAGPAAGGGLRAVRRAAAGGGGPLPAASPRRRQRAHRRPQRGRDHRRDRAAATGHAS